MKEGKIHYEWIHFNFDWSWVKDKRLNHKGNSEVGILIIEDQWGDPIKVYAYTLVEDEEDNKE